MKVALASLLIALVASACGGGSDRDPTLGTMQCPFEGDGCPDGCHPVQAGELDRDRDCIVTVARIACSNAEGGTGATVCVASTDGSRLAYLSGEAFYEPYFLGWRGCSEAEQQTLADKLYCGPACETPNTECPAAEPYCTPTEYAKDCSTDACEAPYECVTVEESGSTSQHCLEACDDACDCPAACVCKGVNGGASWGPDGYCICA